MAPQHAQTLSVDLPIASVFFPASSGLASDTVSESQSLWDAPGRIVLETWNEVPPCESIIPCTPMLARRQAELRIAHHVAEIVLQKNLLRTLLHVCQRPLEL